MSIDKVFVVKSFFIDKIVYVVFRRNFWGYDIRYIFYILINMIKVIEVLKEL